MAALTVTASSVAASASATINRAGTAGASITAGQPVYIDTADGNELKPAQATSAKHAAVGIALNNAEDGQPVAYASKDPSFTPGATLVTGTVYCVGDTTAGDIDPVADLGSGDFVTVLGVATSTSVLNLDCSATLRSGAAIA